MEAGLSVARFVTLLGMPRATSFRENHWRGLADHHTVAFTDVVTHAVKPDYLHHSSGRHRR